MTDERVPEGLVEEIARDYGLDAGRFGAALNHARDEYDEVSFWNFRQDMSDQNAAVAQVLEAVKRANSRWKNLNRKKSKIRGALRFFDGGPLSDPIGDRLQFIIDFLDEYPVQYDEQPRSRGNPGRSRTGAALDLGALRVFTRAMMRLWANETRKPFGHVVETDNSGDHYGRTKKEPVSRVPKSPAIKFWSKPRRACPTSTLPQILRQR